MENRILCIKKNDASCYDDYNTEYEICEDLQVGREKTVDMKV